MHRRQQDRPARLAVPGRPQDRAGVRAVRLDERGDRLRADPRQAGRPEQDRGRVRDLGKGQLSSPDHLAGRARFGRGRRPVDGLRSRQRRGDRAIRIRGEDDDRQRPARPCQVGQPPNARLAERVGERPIGGRGQDDGGDGHGPECTRAEAPTALPSTSMGQSAVPSNEEHRSPVPDAATPDPAADARQRRPRRPAQRRDRRPCRPWQDHARRRDAPPDRRVPLEPGGRRPGHGFGRPGAREGDHDPGQADDRRPRRRPPQHRRHARSRRLRRRGRALAADGRFGAPPRRRGRGSVAPDPLRPPEGDGPPAAGRRRDQQDRPRRRPPGRGPRRHLRAVHGPRRGRPPDRVPDRVHQCQGWHRDT